MKRRLSILIVLLALIGGGVYYSHIAKPSEIVLTGIVTTDDVIVSAQIQGRLQELKVDQGAIVKRDDLLAVIQPAQWQADMAYFSSSQEQASTQVTQAQADLKFQEAQTNSQILQAEANLAAAKAQVAEGEADLENARLNFDREQDLFKQGVESPQAFDQAKAGFEARKAHVDALRKQAQAADAALGVAKSNLDQVAAHRAQLDSMTHQLAAASAQKDKAQVQLGYTEIRAPINGIVDIRAARRGEVVNPGQAIVTLIDPDGLWVRADIEETYVDGIHIGDKLQVRLPSGQTRDGTVYYRGVDADYATQRDVSRTKRDVKTFEIRLRCDNADRSLAVGMTAYVTLPLTK